MAGHHDHHHFGHDHHGHHHRGRAFALGTGLNLGLVLVEVVYGYQAHSLALLADAGHNLGDGLGLLLAWGTNILSNLPPTKRYTYGLGGFSIMGAMANAVVLLLSMGAVALGAVQHLAHPAPVAARVVMVVASVGIIVNTLSALLFQTGRQGDLNIRAAFAHLTADALVSLGVVVAGLVIYLTGWRWVDPMVSLGVAALVVLGTWNLLQESFNLALAGVPEGIRPELVAHYLGECPGVARVHDLHIWATSTSKTALTVHLVMPEGHPGDAFLCQVSSELQQYFGISHTTLQLEIGDVNYPCTLEPDHVI